MSVLYDTGVVPRLCARLKSWERGDHQEARQMDRTFSSDDEVASHVL